MKEIHWYPGHMAKAKRELGELIKYLDVILEVRDARLPESSHNSDIDALISRRPQLVLLNKADLADPGITQSWCRWFKDQGKTAFAVNAKQGSSQDLWNLLKTGTQTKKKPLLRIGVIGIPNVGKSSILNRLLGKASAKTGNLPGITRGKQWVTHNGFQILDTPGLLPPKLENKNNALKLALVGAIREELLPTYDLALNLIENYCQMLPGWLELNIPQSTPEEELSQFAGKRGFLLKGAALDLERAAGTVLKEFRDGKLGQVSLEVPPLPSDQPDDSAT